MQDNYKHKGLRNRLIGELIDKGINDPNVLEAMMEIPRHFFFEKAFLEHAYVNKAFPIGEEQTISQPFTVAYQSSMLNIQPTDRILEIGTGSGYQAAILAYIAEEVITIERHYRLFARARGLLQDMGFVNINCLYGDGYKGSPLYAPFDKIIVTAAAPFIPDALTEQLKDGGVMVIPVDNRNNQQQMLRITKRGNELHIEEGDQFVFVPMLKGKQ